MTGFAVSPSARRPLVEELATVPNVMAALTAMADQPGVLLLESVLHREPLGRYSFLTADPFAWFDLPQTQYGADPFAAIRETMDRFRAETLPDLPPFQGGAAGLLGYELGRTWESWPRADCDEFQFPDMAVGLYDWVLAWDHAAGRAWIISHGFPETDAARCRIRAARRTEFVRNRLKTAMAGRIEMPTGGIHARRAKIGIPQWPAPGPEGLTSDFSRDDYLKAVERTIAYIHAGDIFQANVSQRLLASLRERPLELYRRLRGCNPAPFAGYFQHDDWAVASASPERFLSVRDRLVTTRPIKGTRQRRNGPEADLLTRDELRESIKDRAENVMIVDLLRNDLSRVCAPGSIDVPQLCTVETYETVQHLVSEIRGTLRSDCDAWDLLSAVFPGGSITGAPKVRAMQIISELEPTVRGPYCGSLFYNGFNGRFDSSILIRTFLCRHGWIQCPVGGGIVAQSDPADEYEETLHKAEGMLRALSR